MPISRLKMKQVGSHQRQDAFFKKTFAFLPTIRDTSLTTGGGGLKNRGNFIPEILRSPLSNRDLIL